MSEQYPPNPPVPATNAPEEPVQGEPVQIPVRPPKQKVWLTYGIIAATVLVYLVQMLSQAVTGNDYPAYWGMKINEAILIGQYWRLITPVLLHGSLLHIGFNMLFLYRIGPGLERSYGAGRMLVLYLATAFTGNVLSFLFTPAPSLGASTAIFGLVTAYAVLIYRNRAFYSNPSGALNNIIITIVVNLFLGLSPGIDNFGHLGGLLGGLMIAWFSGPVLGLKLETDGYYIAGKQSNTRYAIVVGAVVFIFIQLAVLKPILF